MLDTTKLSISIVIGGSIFDLGTSIINLRTGLFIELNPLYYFLGVIPFIILYLTFTAIIAIFMYAYDHYFSITHHHLTILTMLTISLYGVFHLWLGYHNFSIFLSS